MGKREHITNTDFIANMPDGSTFVGNASTYGEITGDPGPGSDADSERSIRSWIADQAGTLPEEVTIVNNTRSTLGC